tara:strand:+ start:3092 stop:6694 length:3603 start_codon:yes stop_codon:yes gene_type:complete
MAVKNNSVVEIALKYWIDGKSLMEAQMQAQKEFEKNNNKGRSRNRQQQQADQKRILSESRKLNNKLARARITADNKANKVISANRKKTLIGGFSNFGAKIGTIGSYGAAIAVIGTLQKAIGFAVSSVIEFETAFTDLAVKSGFSNKEMSKVSDTIMTVAASTRFSTMEIIGAATALGKLGFEANDVGEILPNLANVAAATGESLQATAEILGKVINAYEYTAAQSGIISDRMVDIFNNSALNLEKFNTAFSYVGSAAASTGTSFDELTAAMAILSDRGITASKIGTGLRNVFTKLGREGDSLRDILQRVSEEHLSFYEVAELVGRRAANQLFIMANSLDEFDANVARAMSDYGEALRAAAMQQSTFQAKWDIMQNSFKNALAPEFDPNQDFRTAMKSSIDLMDTINSMFGKDNSEATMTRMIALFPDMAKGFKGMKESLGDNTSDSSVLQAMIDRLRVEKEAAVEASRALKGSAFSDDKFKAEIRLINDEISALSSTMNSLNGNTFSSAILKMDEDKVKNVAEKLADRFKKELNNAIDKTRSYNDTSESNKFIDTIFGTEAEFKAGLDRIKELGRITEDQYNFLLKERAGQKTNLYRANYDSNGQDFAKGDEGTLVDALKKQYANRQKLLRDVNQGSLEWTENTMAGDKRVIQKGMDDLDAVRDELCEKYPSTAASIGIKCDDKGRKKKGDIERFKGNVSLDAQYGIDKNKLQIQYRNEDDPESKLKINQDLIHLETMYRDELNYLYESYLKKQERARADFVKRNPGQADAFDENMSSVSDRQTKAAATGEKNQDKYGSVDIIAKQSRWEAAFNEKKKYGLKMAVLNNQLKQLDRSDAKGRKAIMDEMNSDTKAYYAGELRDVNKFFDDLEADIVHSEFVNERARITGDPTIDLSKKKELFAKKEGTIAKVMTDEEKALKNGNRKDNEDFDYLGASIGAFDEITGLMTQMGDAKLEIMQQQADAELAIIQGRHDSEIGILNSALQAGIISQDDAAAAKDRADKRKMAKENKVAKKLFDAQKKIDMQTAIFTGISSTAQAIAQAFANSPNPVVAGIFAGISTAAIAASTSMNIKGISQRKFVPKKFADGGMVHGDSHAQGGVPFTVRGNGGYEMEGGEFIVNKEAAKNNLAELERINGKTRTGKRKFATGGTVSDVGDGSYTSMNEAMLEALSRPVRAYVTTQDLQKSESERNALAKKTSY